MKRSIVVGCHSILATIILIFGSNYDSLKAQLTPAMEAQYDRVNKLQEIPGETKRDPQLERAIFRHLDLSKSVLSDNNITYTYTYVDLNNDGKPEAIVSFSGSYVCGTGGCMVVIFKPVGKEYKVLSSMGLVHAPVIVTETKTNRYKNIVMASRNYGVRKGNDSDYYCYKFNKKIYPYHPMDATRLSFKSIIRGKIYLGGKTKEIKLTP